MGVVPRIHVYICIFIYIYIYINIYIYKYLYIDIHTYLCVSIYLCKCKYVCAYVMCKCQYKCIRINFIEFHGVLGTLWQETGSPTWQPLALQPLALQPGGVAALWPQISVWPRIHWIRSSWCVINFGISGSTFQIFR